MLLIIDDFHRKRIGPRDPDIRQRDNNPFSSWGNYVAHDATFVGGVRHGRRQFDCERQIRRQQGIVGDIEIERSSIDL